MSHIALVGPAVVAGILTSACLSAAAADLRPITKAPAAVASATMLWTGAHVGAMAGYGWASARTSDVNDFDLRPSGGFVGALAGYDIQFANRFVAGVEADAAFANLRSDDSVLHTNTYSAITNQSAFKVEGFGTVRGRLGYAFDRLLPYATGGFAWARTRIDYSQPMTLLGTYFADISDAHQAKTQTGWTLGGGLEYAIAPHWSAKLEYLYMDFGRSRYAGVFWPDVGNLPFDIDTKLTVQTVKMAVSYRF